MLTRDTPSPLNITKSERDRIVSAADKSQTERQKHGFIFQSGCSNTLDLWVPESYQAKWDARGANPAVHPEADYYSFKNISSRGNIELGSIDRQFGIDNDFYLYVGRWDGDGLSIQQIYVMHVKAEYWRCLWPADISPFQKKAVFAGITNSPADDGRWSSRRQALAAQWDAALPAGSPLNWHPKRDHKNQRRIQCSISQKGFPAFFKDTFHSGKTEELRDALTR